MIFGSSQQINQALDFFQENVIFDLDRIRLEKQKIIIILYCL